MAGAAAVVSCIGAFGSNEVRKSSLFIALCSTIPLSSYFARYFRYPDSFFIQFMQKINGDANALAVKVAAESGVERFVYISSIQSTLPPFVLKGSVFASFTSNRIHYSNVVVKVSQH